MTQEHADARSPRQPTPNCSELRGRATREPDVCLRTVVASIAVRILSVLMAMALVVPAPARAASDTVQSAARDRESWQDIRLIEPAPEAPEVAFVDEAGDYRGFVEYRGEVLVAVFWATWCPVCAVEMPKLDRLQAKLGGQGLRVLALSQDVGGAEVVERYYAERGIDQMEIFVDQGAILGSVLGIRGVPTIFVIDRQGRMVGVVEGPAEWDSPEAVGFLRGLLGQR